MITEDKILDFLKKYGIINKRRYKGYWVLPRPLKESSLLEVTYKNKDKEETKIALRRIKILNKKVFEKYLIPNELLIIEQFGKTYKLRIDKDVLREMNKIKGK